MELFQGLVRKKIDNSTPSREDDGYDNNVKLIIKFLEWRKHPIPKSFEKPTVHEIIDIWNCVIKYISTKYRTIDPNVTVTRSNISIVVPSFLNLFSSPFVVDKASMATPHMGAGLSANLHFISWMCKLIIYEDHNFEFQLPNEKFYNDPNLFSTNITAEEAAVCYVKQLISDNYHIAMRSNMDKINIKDLAKNIVEKVKEDILDITKDVQSKSSHFEGLRTDYDKLREEINLIEELKRKIVSLSRDVEQIDKDIIRDKRDVSEREDVVRDLEERKNKETDNLVNLNNELANLKKTIQSQTSIKNEVDRIQNEISDTKRDKDSIKAVKEHVNKSIPALKKEIEGIKDQLLKNYGGLTQTQHKISEEFTVSQSEHYSNWLTLVAPKVDTSANSVLDIIGNQLERYNSEMRPLIDNDTELYHDAKQTFIGIREYLNTNIRRVSDAEEALKMLHDSIESANEILEVNKRTYEMKRNSIETAYKDEYDRLLTRWNTAKEDLAEITRKYNQIYRELADKKNNFTHFWVEHIKEIESIFHYICESKNINYNKLNDLNVYKKDTLASME